MLIDDLQQSTEVAIMNQQQTEYRRISPLNLKGYSSPINVTFGMAINKSQGQMLSKAGIDLTKGCFTHRSCYCSPFRSRANLKISLPFNITVTNNQTVLSLAAFGCAFAQFQDDGRYHPHYRSFNSFDPSTQTRQANPYYPYSARNYGVSYADRDAVILTSVNDINADGGYQYGYETSNGIKAEAVGFNRNLRNYPFAEPPAVQGSFSWTALDGTPVSIRYTADENGYRPVGDAIPTPPPVPAAILRSLEYIKTHRREG
ncbi:Larval cuticle protein LCP-22 [Eumeta japonica]|uniref:Larval cuticle protein LCP-22 n=1 Tax=Eumeta variegata TaxID=151549 RepID=A0A4C1YI04_EUMVA|nr:Larval cuticle protein LCP-22 [Eumeta japonica]